MPVLLLRYAAMLYEVPSELDFGHPFGGYLFTARAELSVPARVEVPLVMNKRRGLLERSSRGMKTDVITCVPTVLILQDWLHIWRIVKCPEASCWSSCAPVVGQSLLGFSYRVQLDTYQHC